MEAINNFFINLGAVLDEKLLNGKPPFFAETFTVGGMEISNLFAIALGLAALFFLVLLAAIIAVACATKGRGGKVRTSKEVKTEQTDVQDAQPAQDDAEYLAVAEGNAEATGQSELNVYGGISEGQAKSFDEQEAQPEQAEEAAPVQEEQAVDEIALVVADEIEPIQEAQEPAQDEAATAQEAESEETLAAPEQAEAVEEAPKAENVPAAVVEEPKAEEPVAAKESKAEEAKEEKTAVEAAVKETKEKPMKEAKPKVEKKEKKPSTEGLVGKFEIALAIDGYRFCLYASNGQLMYESVGFTSIEGCKKGIETFRKTLREMPYSITKDKRGRFRFVFNKKYQGETYTDKPAATRAAESVKRWGADAKVIVTYPTDEEMKVYQDSLNNQRDKSDVDWTAVAKAEANAKKSGKIVTEAEMNGDEVYGYRFYLFANNAQILYTSALYASPATAAGAIDAFKRAVYIGNFYIDEDKTKHFRYILRGNNITYVGESYANKSQAEKSIESVKNFVRTAIVMPYVPDAD